MADLYLAFTNLIEKLHAEGCLWDGCLTENISAKNFDQTLKRALELRFIALIPGMDVSRSLGIADRRLLESFREFNQLIKLSAIERILNEVVAETLVQAAQDATRKNEARSGSDLTIGEIMPDGTIYAGVSPDTQKPMFTTLEDAPLTMKWKQAMEYAAKLDAYTHHDWRVPSRGELNLLFQNRVAIGGFNTTGSIPAGWYWSSMPSCHYDGWGRRFSDGRQSDNGTNGDSSLRCVRG